MEICFDPRGAGSCVYDETIDLRSLGALAVARASRVEPAADGGWTADLSPVGGPLLGPFSRRSAALAAELAWLQMHWLVAPQQRR